MATDQKDPLLARAAEAEERLRRLLERRQNPDASLVLLESMTAEHDPADVGDTEVVADEVLLLTDPDGTTSWALRIIPEALQPASLPEAEPVVQTSVIDGLARSIPQVAQALQRGRVFELIGPPSVLEGLRNGTLEMIPSKTGGLLGAVRAKGTSAIAHQARFRPVKLAMAVGPGLAMVAASAVLGHMHMVEIRKQLARVEGKLDRVLEGQQAARHGKLIGAVTVLQDVARTASSAVSLTPLQQHRLTAAELDLRQIEGELDQLHRRYAARSAALSQSGLSAFVDAFGTTRAIELDDGRLYVAAAGALVILERLLLSYAAFAEPATVSTRELALREACERLSGIDRVLGHFVQFDAHCRRALDADLNRRYRFSTADSERVSEAIAADRLAVAELLASARRLSEGTRPEAAFHVVRVDARGAAIRAQVGLLEPSPTSSG